MVNSKREYRFNKIALKSGEQMVAEDLSEETNNP